MATKIQQGVRSSDTTTPTQIRIDKDQLKMLKILAAVEDTTISNIVRECLGKYIEEHVGGLSSQDTFTKFIFATNPDAGPNEKAAEERWVKKIDAVKTDE